MAGGRPADWVPPTLDARLSVCQWLGLPAALAKAVTARFDMHQVGAGSNSALPKQLIASQF